ncbi:MAG: guanylate kinase [Acidobacteria bacterium]|nr:guanylate kinase [Acidobacteriota bacterium]
MSESSWGDLFVISAPSGSGKTSLAKRILAELDAISFSISFTTRPPRGEEKPGREYHFVDEKQFRQMIAESRFLEWENVYGNYLYGTAEAPVNEALARNEDVLLDVDVKGARKVKTCRPEAILVFVMPPSYHELERRLRQRGLDSETQILSRLRIAGEEIKDYKMYDYLIVNRDIDESVSRLKAIILAVRSRSSRMERIGQAIVRTFGE